jgi:hypothetical protein
MPKIHLDLADVMDAIPDAAIVAEIVSRDLLDDVLAAHPDAPRACTEALDDDALVTELLRRDLLHAAIDAAPTETLREVLKAMDWPTEPEPPAEPEPMA